MAKKNEEPTKEEVLAWYADQIELATVRRDLAVIQAETTKAEAERLQAAMMIGQIRAAEEEMNSQSPVETEA